MRPASPAPLFLARETYRRRRLMDAARILPFAAAVLFLVPVLWASGAGTSAGMAYLFGAWLVLILATVGIARALPDTSEPEDGAPLEPQSGDGEAP